MPTQRKQFGKRGLTPDVGQRWGTQSGLHSHTPAASSYGRTAYAAPGFGAVALEDTDSFSVLKVITFPLGLFFSFRGRIGRAEYWTIGFVRWFLSLIVLGIFYSAQYAEMEALKARLASIPEDQIVPAVFFALMGSTTGLVCWVLSIILAVSLYSLEARRCHDRDVSALWLLLLLIPLVNILYAIYLFIANGFFRGTPGPNRFDTAKSQAHVFD